MSKLKLLFVLLILGGIIDIGRYFIYPNVSDLKEMNPVPTAFMEYRQEEWAEQNRQMELTQKWVPMSQISPNVIKAVLIGEDDKFWNHDGFDVKGMEQALEKTLKKGKVAGGSTISQQLSKNLYLSPSKNPVRKVKEAIITWRIEKTLSKRRILEIYLNVAEWGDGIFGIEAAARHYYHKSAKNLTGREAARLAAVLPNPIKYNPTGDQKYVQNRSRIIYKVLKRRGVVIPDFKEVMILTKQEENVNTETNGSISDLFGESVPEESAIIEKDPSENSGENNDKNSSLTF
ncbi:MAG: monofunctional biosynthetic peptidoglycan transglycosylase [Sulfuricurvum sp.]|uniref:monofunctional biosynthetic peptidoglycan transglycosylase n=1 Tax=Sulfuricurvum sp. TaxID=2025608 RepID=UPI0025E68911|nr:monofunctional biosynthetic peptidoglycan transglycosylase [Sulfuricurvum sp.]MBV5321827.1 monofunctional biosynthetic peptidoglycan transglycosylase [Sulfuricurvum sp.]